jgi:hypothetical protein
VDGIRVTIIPTSLTIDREDDDATPCPVRVMITDPDTNETHNAGEYPHLVAAMASVDRSTT